MQANWTIDSSSLKEWRKFVAENSGNEFSIKRRTKNIRHIGIDLSKNKIWKKLVSCQVTTQQRSGPNSLVSKFLNSDSPALEITMCRKASSVQNLVEKECTKAGLRMASKISKNLAAIWQSLENGEWDSLIQQLKTIEKNTSLKKERLVIDYLRSGKYPGLGPKQSRNFIQSLGLSKYEIPLDSRTLKKMRDMGVNFVPSGGSLSDPIVYIFIQDALQQLASKLDIYPCELDACIFSSFDVDE